jgi:protein-tyrosine phosphatase
VIDGAQVHWAATNLRELGGYVTPHGPVRRGVLYRGGRMDELDDDGLAVYRSLQLHTIVDLRRPDEIASMPTPVFGDERNVHLSVSTGNNAFAEAAAKADDPATAPEVLATAGDYFRSLVTERLHLWRPVVDTVFEAEGEPVLFHCTAGKDRTGFLAALLLKFLDVDDATVFADFEMTTHVRAPFVEQRLEERRRELAAEQGIEPDDVAPESMEAWRHLMSSPPEFLRASFEVVERDYGDWHTLRREGLGIDDDRLDAWRGRVIDPS